MSRSYNTKMSHARQGARYSHRMETRGNASNQGELGEQYDGQRSEDDTSSMPLEHERYQRREAYTVIAPNEDKRKKLLEVQRKEEELSRQRKEAKGKTPIKMNPKKVGGHAMSYDSVRDQQQLKTNLSPSLKAIEMRHKREKWQKEKREKEENEIMKRKSLARQQAERNEKKAALKSELVRSHWQNKYPDQPSSSMDYTSCYRDHTVPDDNQCDDLSKLCRMYPEYDRDVLKEALSAQGSIEGVQELLG